MNQNEEVGARIKLARKPACKNNFAHLSKTH